MRVLTIYPYTFILIFITFAFAHNTNETISLGNIPLTSLTTTPGAPTSTTGGPNQDELSTVLDEDYSPQTHVQADQALPPPQHHEPTLAYVPYPSPAQSAQNPILHCIALIVLLLTFLGFISTFIALPFSFMPSDPRSSDARPSSSSSSGGSSSSSSSANPPQATPYISPNAWMSFFLFVCLVLIILQGPLGLTGGTGVIPGMGDMGSWSGGLPGCNGFVAGAVPWCQPVALVAPVAPVMTPMMPMGQMQVIQHQQPPIRAQPVHQMGGQGLVVGPQGGGEYSWYANSQQPQGMFFSEPHDFPSLVVLISIHLKLC